MGESQAKLQALQREICKLQAQMVDVETASRLNLARTWDELTTILLAHEAKSPPEVLEMEEKFEEKLSPELVKSLIRHTLYKVENEPKYEVHFQSCLTGVSDPFILTLANIAEFLEELEDSEIKVEE
ncbi:hypothetical protein RHMOL_Rhmol01G0250100 [Rhododendron molle]|uniref:Uncharacterized protein n=1 Tax=Rhododendron molle TaxID=49168 RepID=A0ACC0Q5G7_RHOML|nr:hypothetical protein RHMOL_Rhmol01G0250100 [Rhododendron molle]